MRNPALWLCLLACGGTASPGYAGHWTSSNTALGSGFELTLSGAGSAVSGTGIRHREAGAPTNFTVSGALPGTVGFQYEDNTSESFQATQPDGAHLVFTGATRTLDFTRG